jgi:hypothetical protein
MAFIQTSLLVRNLMGAFAIGALFVAMGVFGPDWYKKETELRCDPGWKLMATYPDMTTCSVAMPKSQQCGCNSLQNELAPVFSKYVVPLVLGLVAGLLLRGTRLIRIAWLNAGFWSSILVMGVYYAFANAEGVEGLVLSTAHFLYVALAASGILLVFDFLARGISAMLPKRAQS